MKYTVEMAPGGMIYIPSFMKICSSIQVILRLSPRQSERLQCWCYKWEGFMNYAIDMGSGALMYVPSFIQIGSGIQKLIRGDTHTDTDARARTHKHTDSNVIS
jgi:uncharacterized RmlC-like cupin family protein